jgi:hypothetical protein
LPGGHHIYAPIKQRLADIAREAEARGGIFGVGDRQIDIVSGRRARAAPSAQDLAQAAHNVADEQNGHAGCLRFDRNGVRNGRGDPRASAG